MIRRSIAPPTGAENHGAYTLTVKGTRGGVSTRGPASTSSNTASSFWSADGPGAPLQEKHSCTSPDVDVPATGGLLAPRTNTLLPPRFFARTNQFAGRWHGNACGGLPPRLALLRSLSHSFAASQSNAPDITGGAIKVPRRWRRRREARAVKPAVASHRPETERQELLALLDGWRSGPCWGALHLSLQEALQEESKAWRYFSLKILKSILA